MPRRIDLDAEINSIRLKEQGFAPATPDSGYGQLYIKSDGLYFKGDNGAEIGPLGTGSSGSGAPTNAQYVTVASDAELSAELVIPGFAAHADAPNNFPSLATAYEFDDTDTVLTWDSAPAIVDSNTTIPNHLYIKFTDNTNRFGFVAWTPGSGTFDVRTKVLIGAEYEGNYWAFGLLVADDDNSERAEVKIAYNNALHLREIEAGTYTSSTYTKRGEKNQNVASEMYLRMTRDSSNNISFYYSSNGILWQLIATQSFILTVTQVGFEFAAVTNSQTYYAACDWIRANV